MLQCSTAVLTPGFGRTLFGRGPRADPRETTKGHMLPEIRAKAQALGADIKGETPKISDEK